MGPQGREYFDFYDPEGTRLTAVSYPEKVEKYPDARITNFAPFRIGVTVLSRSVGWYRDLLGMAVEEDDTADGCVCMSGWRRPAPRPSAYMDHPGAPVDRVPFL